MKPTTFSPTAAPVRRRRRTPQEIATLVAEYRRSGLSQHAFATSRGISLSTFTNWLGRLRPGGALVRSVAQRLVPVRITGPRPWEGSAERIEIVLRSGVIVRLPQRFDDAAVERLLGIVSERC